MKKNIKFIFGFIIGGIICTTIGVYAAMQIQAHQINYNGTPLDEVLDDLYSKANGNKTCLYVSGTKGQVASKYLCDPGDGVARYFYILKTETNDVKLIMEKNLSDDVGTNKTMNFSDAVAFFDENHPGYATKHAWTSVKNVDLPSAQDIADAGNIQNLDLQTFNGYRFFGSSTQNDGNNKSNYSWLYNYTRNCDLCINTYPNSDGYPSGYWTKNLLVNDNDYAWHVIRGGALSTGLAAGNTYSGVRPVITVSKSNLSE